MSKTVWIEKVEDCSAYILCWQHQVNRQDVAPAFEQLNQVLDQSDGPVWVVVDLRADPIFPFIETVMAAMSGPFKHPRLSQWLVVGANPQAKVIGRTLTSLTKRDNIMWFDDVDAVSEYVRQHLGSTRLTDQMNERRA